MTKESWLFERWPRAAARQPLLVLAAACVVLAGFSALYALLSAPYADSFNIPGTEAQRLINLLKHRFPQSAGDSANVVVRAEPGIHDPAVTARVQRLIADLSNLPDVVAVSSPFDREGAISPDGTTALITVRYDGQAFDIKRSSVDALLAVRREYSRDGLQVEAGGEVIRAAEREPPGSSELIGLAAAVVILLIAFGSVVAMGLPLVTALIALIASFLLIGVGARFFNMPQFTPQFAAMIGIGVGIDYALLVSNRFREARHLGGGVESAIVEAAGTAGRSVLFAGGTVVIALLGLSLVGIPFVAYLGGAASIVVLLSVLIALLVLPALMALAGPHIDRLHVPGLPRTSYDSETGIGYRWSLIVQRAPWLWAALSLAILLLLAAPLLGIRLGVSDAGGGPQSATSRRAYDLLAGGFGVGFNGPVIIGIGIDNPAAAGVVADLPRRIEQIDGVANVSAPRFNEERTAATITVIPKTAPQSAQTDELVHRLRSEAATWEGGQGAEILVGGPTAVFIDLGDKIAQRMPFFFAAVIGLSFVLLMAVFRSVLIPIKAAIMNLLSIGAAYGVIVAVFQWGWFSGVFGVSHTGPIESFVPLVLFAVLFGLSMDYEVFLVSRIREEYLEHGDNTQAVARGLSVTTRVITAAAAIMIAVFLSFALSDQRVVKEFGLGLAAAIFIDATLVRLVLVPSLMQMFGRWNWWFPRWLDRLVPSIAIEPRQEAELAPATGGD
ncbi:MAG: MMPL family transporter [Dehalococcoidia bacterium]|nr:MAG: MMPL family transporter [Dehalococcoidia bacterium]